MKRTIFTLSTLVLPACAPLPPAAPLASLAIAGAWKTDCMPIGKNGRHGFITRLAISRTTITASAQIYAHSNCDTPTVRTDYHAAMAGFRTVSAGTTEFEQIVRAITLTPKDPEVVTIYNADPKSGCGMAGGWKLGVSRGVEGRYCAPFTYPVSGTTLYERAWVSGDDLRIGSFPVVWSNISPEKRPTAPGPLVFHRVSGREK